MILRKQRHEKFAQLVASGMATMAAYGEAGFVPNDQNSRRLRNRPLVKARIEELQALSAAKVVGEVSLTREFVIAEQMEAIQLAKAAKQFGAMNSGLALLAKILGLLVDRTEATVTYKDAEDFARAYEFVRSVRAADRLQ